MKRSLLNFKIFTLSLVLLLAVSVVNAQTATASGSWNAPGTWTPAVVPASTADVTIANGVTVTITAPASCASITFGATNQTGGITISGSNTLTVTNGITIGDLTDNSSGILISVGGGSLSCGSFTMADVTGSNDENILSVSTGTITVTNNLTMNGAAGTSENYVSVAGGTLNVGTLSPVNGGLILTGTTYVNYTGAGSTIRPATYTNLTLSGTGAKTVTGVTVNTKLSLQGAATATGTSPTYATAAVLEYKGTGAQSTSGVEFPGTGANPTNVIIDNAAGVTLNAAKSINGTLTLTNGYLTTTTTNLLTINANGSASTASGAFVNGPLAKIKNTTALFTFPVGNLIGGLRTIGVTPQSTTATTYRATFTSADPRSVPNGTNLGGIAQISGCEYWDLAQTSGTTPARVTISWPAAANSCGNGGYVGDPGSLIVAHHNGTSWSNEGQSSTSGDPITGGRVTSNNFVTTFSPFALGTTDAAQNPLPVMFYDVKAFEKNNGVQIEWSNLTERDLVKYIVEHSANSRDFTSISQQLPRSNQNDKESYSSFDATPISGVNYYRIKVIEVSGKIIYSKVLKVEIGRTLGSFTLYPNPVTNNVVAVEMTVKKGRYTLRVLNNSGQEVHALQLNHQGGKMSHPVQIPSSIKAGVYNMLISGDNYHQSKMFVFF